MKRGLILAGLFLIFVAATTPVDDCQGEKPKPVSSGQREWFLMRRERIVGFGDVYLMKHEPSGTCLVVLDPGGEGGGAVTQVEKTICERAVETTKEGK